MSIDMAKDILYALRYVSLNAQSRLSAARTDPLLLEFLYQQDG